MKVINNIHKPRVFSCWTNRLVSKPGIWGAISRVAKKLHDSGIISLHSIVRKVGDGRNTLFWLENWLGSFSLAERYPRLFRLDRNQNCLVSDRLLNGEFIPDWIRPLRGGATVMEADEIVRLVGLYVFGNGKDTWAWSLEGMDDFVVKGVRSTIEESLSPSSSFTRWIKWVPRKVNIHAWRTLLDRLPTRVSLSNKGLDIPSTLCPMCNNETESLAHVFAFCSIACKVWSSISRWLDVGFLDCCSPQDLMYKVDDLHLPVKKKLVIEGIIYSAWWVIWRHRNDEVFSAKKHRFVCLFDSIVHFSFIWYSNRVSKSRISWDEWILNPLLFL